MPVGSRLHLWEFGFLLVIAVDVDIKGENGQGRTGGSQVQRGLLAPHSRSQGDKHSPPWEPSPGAA